MKSMDRKSVFFPPALWRKIARAAKGEGISASAWLRLVASRALGENHSNRQR